MRGNKGIVSEERLGEEKITDDRNKGITRNNESSGGGGRKSDRPLSFMAVQLDSA